MTFSKPMSPSQNLVPNLIAISISCRNVILTSLFLKKYFIYLFCCTWSLFLRRLFSRLWQAGASLWLWCTDFSCCGTWTLGHSGLSSCSTWAQRHRGMWGSPWTREWTRVSCIAGRSFAIWATKEALDQSVLRIWWILGISWSTAVW